MYSDISKKVEELDPILQKILDAGFYTKEVTVLGTKASLHVLVKDELIEVNRLAGQSTDLMTRQHLLNVWALAHATSEIAGVAMRTPEAAYNFFSLMTETMFDHWFKAYADLIPKTEEQVNKLLVATKK